MTAGCRRQAQDVGGRRSVLGAGQALHGAAGIEHAGQPYESAAVCQIRAGRGMHPGESACRLDDRVATVPLAALV